MFSSRKLLCVIIILLQFACNSDKAGNATSKTGDAFNVDSQRRADSLKVLNNKKLFKAYRLNKDYTVIDTGEFAAGTLEGKYAIVKNGEKEDTIHLGLGIKEVGYGKYFYLKLTKYASPYEQSWPGLLSATFDHYAIAGDNKNIFLDEVINDFDTYKSAPDVINGKIYFWQYSKTDSIFKVSAAEYDIKTGSTKSHYLFSGDLSDNEHITSPNNNNNIIEFNWEKQKWKFSPDFKLIK